ncbi:cytochrome P450 [Nocardiopsis ansamitocini]|uniref:Mycocyclosin synthase n=1 Tax=Nocardiopsis ansamitocini TaxID=1670832 RepID=A0A9W6P985_9ACTN|nr:cytochrome P450 [Nocardiopsis ansamitocini]GLU49500.1 mycocyclosin synthase [Nocardiopsis ansamitocini]
MNETLPYFPFAHHGDAVSPECRQLQETRPISRVRTASAEAWLITSHPMAVRALEDERLSPALQADLQAPGQVLGMPADAVSSMETFARDGLRKEFLRAIAPPRLAELEPWARGAARSILDGIAASPQPVDLFSGYARRFPIALSCRLVGMPLAEGETLAELSEAVMSLRPREPDAYLDDWQQLRDYFSGLLARPGLPDGVARRYRDANAARPPADRVDETRVADALAWFFESSHVSASSVLGHAFVTMLDQCGMMEHLRGDSGDLSGVVEEALRHALFLNTGLQRVARQDIELGGTTIRAGELVLISADTANRDPEAFPRPECFDPSRAAKGHLAFGHGAGHCPGSALGRLMLKVAIGELADRFPRMRLAVPCTEIEWRDDLLNRRPIRIPVSW